jgi:hypothetical protein
MDAAMKQGYERYQSMILEWGTAEIRRAKEGASSLDAISDRDRDVFSKLFHDFTHINDAIQNMDLCLEFVRGRMPRRKGLSLYRYMNYHVTFYLQEVYILEQRLTTYLKNVKKLKVKLEGKGIAARFDSVDTRIHAAFLGVKKIRGLHVHARPFTDQNLDFLSMYSVLAEIEPTQFKEHEEDAYFSARYDWKKQMVKNKESIKDLLDQVFDFLYGQLTTGKPLLTAFELNPLIVPK